MPAAPATSSDPIGRIKTMLIRARWSLLAGLGAVLIVLPDLLGLDSWTPWAQFVAFRPQWCAVLGATALMALPWPGWRREVGIGLAVVCLVGASLIVPRQLGSVEVAAEPDIRVLTINVLGGRAAIGEVAGLIRRHKPELIALPEADETFRLELESRLLGSYGGFTAQSQDSAASAVSAMYLRSLGAVEGAVSVEHGFPRWALSGGRLGNLTFVAYHAYPPLPLHTARWRDALGELRQWCQGDGPVIIAGDFNASLDHGPFRRASRGCLDTASALGQGLSGTWPTSLPGWLGTQIDHVMYHGQLRPQSIVFSQINGGDHLAVLAGFSR